MLSAVEVLENAMLCVTFAMTILGYLFLFAGFFVRIEDMPRWISWISYLAPTKYSFDGYLHVVFQYQTFLVSGSSPRMYISGGHLLDSRFNRRDCRAWEMFGVLLGFIVAVRLLHFALFTYHVLPFLPSRKSVFTLEDERERLSSMVSDMDDENDNGEDKNSGISPLVTGDASEDERDIEIGADYKVDLSLEDDIPESIGRIQWR